MIEIKPRKSIIKNVPDEKVEKVEKVEKIEKVVEEVVIEKKPENAKKNINDIYGERPAPKKKFTYEKPIK